MTKQIIFIFALLCTLQAQASVQPVQKDTVRHTIHYEVAELLQPMQPVYLNGVLLPASRIALRRCLAQKARDFLRDDHLLVDYLLRHVDRIHAQLLAFFL